MTEAETVTVLGGRVTVSVLCGRVVREMVVAGEITLMLVLEVSPRVPVIVTAPAETEVPSATRFHGRKEAIVTSFKGVWGEGVREENVPFEGIRIVPVEVTLTREE